MDGKSKLLLFGIVTPAAYRSSDFSEARAGICWHRSAAFALAPVPPPLARPPLLSGGQSPDVTMAASFFTILGRGSNVAMADGSGGRDRGRSQGREN